MWSSGDDSRAAVAQVGGEGDTEGGREGGREGTDGDVPGQESQARVEYGSDGERQSSEVKEGMTSPCTSI